MTKEEYKAELLELEKQYVKQKNALHVKYALANNPYKEGDIVTDDIGSIKINKIKVRLDIVGIPLCAYLGLELKKDFTPTKRNQSREVCQKNIITTTLK